MSDNSAVDLKGSDGNTYRGILHTVEEITTYQTLQGAEKGKRTRQFYELYDGRKAELNRFGQFQTEGTNITLKPV